MGAEENVETTWRDQDHADDQVYYVDDRDKHWNKEKDDNYPQVASPPADVVMAEPKDGFTRTAVLCVTFLLLSAAWGIVALTIYLLVRVLTDHGFSSTNAALIAAPAVIVPLWKTVGVLRQGSLERVLVGQLWILNGAIAWGLLVLATLWWIDMVSGLMEGGRSGVILALAAAGFIPLVSFLYLVNAWILRRWGKT